MNLSIGNKFYLHINVQPGPRETENIFNVHNEERTLLLRAPSSIVGFGVMFLNRGTGTATCMPH